MSDGLVPAPGMNMKLTLDCSESHLLRIPAFFYE
jgi:hypothetical protein